jgi:hypothetical protein
MPPATARNRPQMLFVNLAGGQRYEYRPTLVDGVLQWVLRPVKRLAYFIRILIHRARAAMDFWDHGYHVRNEEGGEDLEGDQHWPYMVDLLRPRLQPGEY